MDRTPLDRELSRAGARIRLACVLAACVLTGCALGGCVQPVPFYKRRAFADPVMDLASDPLEAHWYAKIHYSMEGAIGGFSSTGGGGCGCY